jgi:hypothetical protein
MANRRFIDFPIASTVGDNDIVLIWQDGLNKQTTKATLFAGSPNSLAGLTDVDISALANGQILQYNSTTSKWENVDRTDIDLDQLGDVTIVSPTNGQVLVYNSSTSKWENSSAGFVPYTGAVTTVNLGAQSILAGSFVKAGGTSAQFLKADGSVDSNTYGTGTVTSVALTMPSAFSVANSPVTTAGTLAVTGAGTVAQYVRGDGSLATFPALTGFVPYTGATSDVNLGTHDLTAERGTFQNNGSSDTLTVNHTSGSGYGIIVTKGGNNEALYVSKTSGSGNAMTVVGGRTSLVDLALSSVTNTAGDFLTLSGGVVHKRTAAEVRTDIGAGTVTSVAALTLGTNGTDLSSTVANGTTTPVITLNVPTASATNRGALSAADWTTFNNKQNALTNPVTGTGASGQVAFWNGTNSITSDADLLFDGSNLTVAGNLILANGANRVLRIGSLTNYNYDLAVNGEDLQIIEAATTPRLTIKYPNGNVLIGTTTDAGFKLDVNGTGRFSSSLTVGAGGLVGRLSVRGTTNDSSAYSFEAANSSGNSLFVVRNDGPATFSSSVTATQFIASGGNNTTVFNSTSATTGWVQMAMNNTSGSALLGVENSSGGTLATGTSAYATVLRNYTNTDLQIATNNIVRTTITSGGNVLIGTTTDYGVKLAIAGNVIMPTGGNREIYMGSASSYNYRIRTSGDDFIINEANSVDRLKYVYADTRWYITGGLTISGSLSKGSGSFKIDHPLPAKKDTHHLVHSFIEGPQADNIYRGKIQLVNGKAEVNIDYASGMSQGTFVLLNGNVQCFTSNESGWVPIKGTIEQNILKIEAENSNCNDLVSWLVVGERQDKHMIDTNWTDKNGKVIVEPQKK